MLTLPSKAYRTQNAHPEGSKVGISTFSHRRLILAVLVSGMGKGAAGVRRRRSNKAILAVSTTNGV